MGPLYRQLSRVFTAAGVRLELPYFDDRVVEAALAVPNTTAAHRGGTSRCWPRRCGASCPKRSRHAHTKAEFSEDVRLGLRRHLPEILEVFADSALATHGLINPDLLRHELLAPQARQHACMPWKTSWAVKHGCAPPWHPPIPGRNSVAATAP